MFGDTIQHFDYFRVREKKLRSDNVDTSYDLLPTHKQNYTISQKISDINDRSKLLGPGDFVEIDLGNHNLTKEY